MTYDELVEARRVCNICMQRDPEELRNPSSFEFDRPIVSYWSQWMGHQSPELLIVGQDFSDIGFFEKFRGDDEADCDTNRHLQARLADAGYTGISLGRDPAAPIYLANAVLCLKRGKVDRPVKDRWIRNCATTHLTKLIAFLRPLAVVATGRAAWNATLVASKLSDAPERLGAAIDSRRPYFSTLPVYDGIAFFAASHTSGKAVMNRGTARQIEDWKSIGGYLAGLREQRATGREA